MAAARASVGRQSFSCVLMLAVVVLASCESTNDEADATSPTTTVDPVIDATAAGYIALCNDGGFSNNTNLSRTCSNGDGVASWLAPFGECNDGRVIVMKPSSDCDDHDGFRGLLPVDYEPTAGPDDVAMCNDGGYSDNTNLSDTCSNGDGVARWLAPFGECNDGRVIVMKPSSDCGDHDGFRGLLPVDYEPTAGPDDVAMCNDGGYSDNTNLSDTCSNGDGVARWLARYAECNDRAVVELGVSDCDGHNGFARLLPADFVPPSTTAAPTSTSTSGTTTTTPSAVVVTSVAPGSVSALDLLNFVTVTNEHQDGYVRELFAYPSDLDNDGCDTRDEVLVRDSLTPAQVDMYGCAVVAGDWFSSYDGMAWSDPAEVQIDHVVALKEAWDSGAWSWENDRRLRFSNDLEDSRTLRVVSAEANDAKGASDPSNWIPPNDDAVCGYLADWIAIKVRWTLTMDQSEHARIRNVLTERCSDQMVAPWPETLPPPSSTTLPAPTTTAAQPPQPFIPPVTVTSEVDCDPSYPDVCIPAAPPDLDCGEIPFRQFTVVGSDPHGFDRDNDGIGCESP